MQFFNAIVFALVGAAVALPNAAPAAEADVLEKRCSGNYEPCAIQSDCCGGFQCFTKGGYCV